jgi:SpoVK/Ycf46/Vps4 family AAA+-type ATPase
MARCSVRNTQLVEDYDTIARLWCLRAIVYLASQRKGTDGLLRDADVGRLVGYDPLNLPDDQGKLRRLVTSWLVKAEAEVPATEGLLFENLRLLGTHLDLTPLDLELVALFVLSRIEDPLHDTLERAEYLTDPKFRRFVAKILRREHQEVAEALSPAGRLVATRLVMPGEMKGTFEDKFKIHDSLPQALTRRNASLEELMSFAAARAGAPALSIGDYGHLVPHLEILIPYLARAIEERRRGVNVLLYGGAGNGKTELAKVLARDAGLHLYEVRHTNNVGFPESPADRISSYTLMQSLLHRQARAAILFDEIEDILPSAPSPWDGEDRGSLRRKAWFNHTLEDNPVPAIWIGNRVSHVDPAFLRRFDYVMELGPPPRVARERMLRAGLAGLTFSDAWLDRKADDRSLSPGVFTKIARVLAGGEAREAATVERRFDLMAQARQEAQGDAPQGRYPYPEHYRIELLNASFDPLTVARRLGLRSRASVLLYGPPGTGKTAYAHYLARQLGRSLLVKRASDLLSMWLGETEKLICAMFREAAADKAVLLLDEADSLLQDRRTAERSWEVTQVNELLTRMEEFEGIFVCATNFSERLDPAAMRRFGLKVRFDPLAREQALTHFRDTLADLKVAASDELELQRALRELGALSGLTPGDFAAARKALDLDAYARTAHGLVEALSAELAAKPGGGRRPIGFAA